MLSYGHLDPALVFRIAAVSRGAGSGSLSRTGGRAQDLGYAVSLAVRFSPRNKTAPRGGAARVRTMGEG